MGIEMASLRDERGAEFHPFGMPGLGVSSLRDVRDM
jgi:hypothetical protein